jgi:TetR/AcrR family transcriptional regulator
VPTRDGEQTREAVLQAAEDLFARDGFEATSLQRIGEAAGYARSTPGYFFHSKQELYDQVLRRVLGRAQAAMEPAYAAAADESTARRALTVLVDSLLQFISHDPNFVRLIQREALANRPALERLLTKPTLSEMLTALSRASGRRDAEHAFLEIFALCWFPFAHSETLLPALGFDADDPAFQREHHDRIVRLFAASSGERQNQASRG